MGDIVPQGTSLVTRREIHSMNTELCIICQKSTNDVKNLLQPIILHNDEVYQCLLTNEGTFSYNMNDTCQKEYTK